jgi:hypothetical protein
MTEHPAAPTPDTNAGERLYLHIVSPDEYGWPTDDQLRTAIRAIESEARAAARKEVADRLRVEFESRFDDQWPEWMDEAWNAAVDSLSTDTREATDG